LLFCEHCKGIINDNEDFYEIHNKFYCKECVVDDNGVYEVKDTNISVNTKHKFFIKNQARKHRDFGEATRRIEDDIYNLEDSLKYCIEQVARNTKKENKSSIKHWEKRVEEKKKYLEEFLKATSSEGTLF
jgi:hypothetical protein